MNDTNERNVADELTAIKAVADALQPLPTASRRHVIAYVAEALGLSDAPSATHSRGPLAAHEQQAQGPMVNDVAASSDMPIDIRSLKEQKEPRSANEMAALVAYYVSELLPSDEQRTVITAADIEKYFKQANYRLPSRVAQTLPDAARAGYFDVVDRGQYRLNPVGYNLVAHGMPSRDADASTARSARPRKSAGRRTSKKAAKTKAAGKSAGATRKQRPTPSRLSKKSAQ